VVGKFLPDAVWWFYLYWTAKFLDTNFHVPLSQLSLPLVTIYLLADVGSVGGGWLSSWLLGRGWSVNAARKTALLLCAICVVPVTFAPLTSHLWVAVLLVAVAAAAHQGWSANVFTLASDMFPKQAVGSVVGIGGMAGAVGGMVLAETIGKVLTVTGSYVPIFIIAGSAYVSALGLMHLLVPRLEPVRLGSVGRP
jgi:ACS family hexuronate transporter-like MFS transporter